MNGFISYAHDDHELFREFRTHLTAIEHAFDIEFWADTSIRAGYHWDATIQRAIDAADVFVLLVSNAFIANPYIYGQEIPAIRDRHRDSGALVLPVVVDDCFWLMVAGALQAVPSEHGRVKPILDWHPRRNGCARAREQISASIQRHFGMAPKTVAWSAP